MKFMIRLHSPEEAEEFVKIASGFDYDIDLKTGAAYLDAKSLLGVISCALNKKAEVICPKNANDFKSSVSKFAVA
ncbi:MAG TPA: phosphocarrier protein HPr [Lachnospiraceae bacterium]|nr:HPr family phosphocarrier protein [Lachnospiraceae bacterium]MDD7665332.1 HPr family phosphocarrier protein [Lachnospiraceae bacterium]MDY4164859.1 HPr family phosphocarrier protein [Lachnospiraceae bacterium]HAP03405.1 phosphocarrier protein HPr [Lachnospiraceae bacterium]